MSRKLIGNNALSGIGGFQTYTITWNKCQVSMGLNVLSGIGGFQTWAAGGGDPGACLLSLNALSGIGGFQTCIRLLTGNGNRSSLNALSGIGGFQSGSEPTPPELGRTMGLNALSGIGGFQHVHRYDYPRRDDTYVLMPCRALEAFRPRKRDCLYH